ncbi:MAG TPA: hypothetical protein VNB54_10195 [Alphaproteobacteria bacterium]|nr:hypothetical protein [Alphaproteobacteria bacterium]
MHDTVRELEQQPEVLPRWLLLGRRAPHMRGTERTCKCRTEAVRRQRRADTPLPELHSWELHILARLRPGIPAHPKLHSPERPAALHRTGNQGGFRTGNVGGLSHGRSAGGKCAPNGYGDEERDAGAADAQAHAALV